MKTSLFSIVLMVAFGSVVIGQSLESGEEAALSDAPALPMAEPQLQKGAEQTVSGRWIAAGSPYLIEENLIVAAGDSLIIEPGVTIRFSGLHQVKIQGVLLADGTEDAGIVFTSARSEPASGDWWGILFDGPKARGRLRYVTLRFMSIGVDAKKSGPVTVTQCEISDAKFAGIRWAQTAQAGALRDSRIFRSHVGVMCKAGASPALVGNIVMDNAYVGILCEEGASPSIEGNTLVRNRTSGIACFAGSDPTISKTLIVRNGNGVSCTASSPRIVGCAIYDNEFSGVLCFQQAAPSISGSNIFKNGLSGVRNVSDQNVSTEEVWWGEDVADPGVCIYDGEDRSGYGKVLATDWRSAPNPGVPGQPAVESLTLRADKEGAETIGEELIIENPIWVTLTGADGGPYTVDYTSVTFRLGQEGSARTLVLYETSENSGLFQRRIIPSEVREDRVRFMAAYGDVLSFASDLDPTMRVATRITRRTAEITHLAIEGIDRTTKAPLFVWEYSDPEGDPQAQFEIEVGEEAGGAGAKMWASGPVASSDSEMEYGGRELEEGKTYFVRVRAHDGFSWGPWAEIPFHINTAPSAPNLLAPPDGSTIDRLPPRLIVGGSVDPDGDALAYHFELYYTAEMDSAKMAGSSPEPVPAEGAETLWPDLPRLLENTQYWWRARATDGDLFGPWSEASTFLINTEEEEINPFSLRSPKDGAVVELFRPLFQWERTYDPDPLQEITYAVFYSADSTFAKTKVIKGLKKEIGEMLPRSDLAEDTIYYWMVAAVLDENTLKWAREGSWRFFVNTVNDPPEIRPIPEISFAEDTEFTALDLDAFVSDPDHPRETLTWTCSSDANLSAAVGKDHGITLTPEPNYHGGPVSFVVTATDPEGAAGQVSFSATVLSVNDPPVASAIEDREIEEDTATRIDLIGYAQDLDHALNSLSWTSLQGPEVEVTIQGSVAKIQPVENWNGTTAIAFSMTDPEGGKDETTMNLTVTSVNDAPVIGVLPPVSFAEDGSFVLSLDDYVSDVDHPKDALLWTAKGGAHVIVRVDSLARTAVLTAPPDWHGGPETVTFVVKDPMGAQATGSVPVTVTSVNDPPVLTAIPDRTFDEDTALSFDLNDLVKDLDHPLEQLQWRAEGQVSIRVEIAPSTHRVTMTAPKNWYGGPERITFTVTDPEGGQDKATAAFTVASVVEPPAFAEIPGIAFDEDGSTSFDLDEVLTDPDHPNEALTLTIGKAEHVIVSFDAKTHEVRFSAPKDWNGDPEAIPVTATDPDGASCEGTLSVVVTPVNDAPVLGVFPEVAFDEDGSTPLDLDRYVTDVDDTDFSWAATAGAKVAVRVDAATNTAFFSAPENWNGTEEVTFTVTDKVGASASATVVVTVTPVNDPPVLEAIPEVTFEEDGSFDFVLDPLVSDVDHTDAQMTWNAMGMTAVSVRIDPATHVAIFSAQKDWNGSEQGTLTVRDAEGGTAQAKVTVQVTPVNDAPVLGAIPAVAFDEDDSGTLALDRYVSDVDDTDFSWTVTPGAKVVVRVDAATNTAIFSAPKNWNGTEELTFTVMDKARASASGTVVVTVTSVNDPPVLAVIPSVTFEEDGSFDLALDALVSDVDHPDAQMTWNAKGTTAVSVRIDPSTQVATFFAQKDWNGSEQGTLTVRDAEGGAAQAKVTVQVTPVNDPPVLGAIPAVAFDEDGSTTLDLDRYVSDVDDTDFSWTVTPGAKVVVRVDAATNTAFFSAPENWNGTEEMTFTVKDKAGASVSATVRATISSVNDPPVLAAIPAVTFEEDGSFDLALDALVSDVDHTDAQMTWNAMGTTAVSVRIDPSTQIATFSAQKDWNGSEQGTLTVRDAEGGAAQAKVTVQVTPVNDAPVLGVFPEVAFDEDGSTTLDLDRYVSDVDDTDFSWTVKAGAQVAVRLDPAANIATFSAPENWNGTEEMTFTVKDKAGVSVSGTVVVTVTSVNDPPVLKALPEISFVAGGSERLALQRTVTDVDHPFSDLIWSATGNVNVRVTFEGGESGFGAIEGWTGSETLELTVRDPEGGKAAASLRVTVVPAEE